MKLPLFKRADNGETRGQLQVPVLAPSFNSTSNNYKTAHWGWTDMASNPYSKE